MKKIIGLLVILGAVFFFLGKDLNPFDPHMFTIHDSTQAARMQEFALNLKNGIIPPRLAPNFSLQHGFPVFNFYAPFAYWIGGLLHLVGFSSALSLKLVLFIGLLVSFISFFLFASLFTGFWGGILGATIYSSSLWMAVEIFVRGNVGEIWFMALLPLSLYLLKRSDVENKNVLFLFSCVILSFLFTVHNVLSLVSVVFVGLFVLGLHNKKKAFLSIFIGLLLASYFLIPAALENKLTYASEIASRTKYKDHFLCAWQLWKADKWSYGGSGVGCKNDDMSFQIGKVHILFAMLGLGVFTFLSIGERKKKKDKIPFIIGGLTLFFAFLTTYYSQPVWDLFSPLIAVFQFPWRFLPYIVFGVAFFASYTGTVIKNQYIQGALIIMFSLGILFTSSKFFSKPWKFTFDEYTNSTLSKKYIETKAAYEIPEYFPRFGSYKVWRRYDTSETGFYTNPLIYRSNTPFYKKIVVDQNQITLPIHYFPFWEIKIDGKQFIPAEFDELGRPILSGLILNSIVTVQYNETPIEKAGNSITVITFIIVIAVILNKRLWKKMSSMLQ